MDGKGRRLVLKVWKECENCKLGRPPLILLRVPDDAFAVRFKRKKRHEKRLTKMSDPFIKTKEKWSSLLFPFPLLVKTLRDV